MRLFVALLIAPIVLAVIGSLWFVIERSMSTQSNEGESKEMNDLGSGKNDRFEELRPLREAKRKLADEYQKEIDKGWQLYATKHKPAVTVSASKVGHEDKYHLYFDPYDAKVGDKAEVYYDQQFGDDYDNFRDAYVVSVDGYEVGELTENTIDRIELHTPWDTAVYTVASVREDSSGKTRLRLNVIEQYDEIPGHRTWPMTLRGTNYDGRAEVVKENGPTICKLDATTYEGEPAVRVLDVLDRELGWVPKEYAEEVTKYINKGKVSEARIDNIEHKEDKVYALLFLLIKNYM